MAKAIIQQQVDYLEVFRKSLIGVPMTFVAQEVPDAFMICDGSLVLFEDWPEFKEAYDAGKFTGMVLDTADSSQVGKFVKNGDTGLYLPDLTGLFVQSSATETAGAYVAPGLPNLYGYINTVIAWNSTEASGVFTHTYRNDNIGSPSGTQMGAHSYAFNASNYNAIYSDAVNTVQPPTVKYVMAMYLGKPAEVA